MRRSPRSTGTRSSTSAHTAVCATGTQDVADIFAVEGADAWFTRIVREGSDVELILLAIEDVTQAVQLQRIADVATAIAKAGGGIIVNIGSFFDKIGVKRNLAYCASKAAVGAMTRCLAVSHCAHRPIPRARREQSARDHAVRDVTAGDRPQAGDAEELSHLDLADHGLVLDRRHGRWIHYTLNPEALDLLAEFIASCRSSRATSAGWRRAWTCTRSSSKRA